MVNIFFNRIRFFGEIIIIFFVFFSRLPLQKFNPRQKILYPGAGPGVLISPETFAILRYIRICLKKNFWKFFSNFPFFGNFTHFICFFGYFKQILVLVHIFFPLFHTSQDSKAYPLLLLSQRCCKIFLPSFFKFFDAASTRMRNNMIIMMTDLCFRFPNVFNDFNDQFITK